MMNTKTFKLEQGTLILVEANTTPVIPVLLTEDNMLVTPFEHVANIKNNYDEVLESVASACGFELNVAQTLGLNVNDAFKEITLVENFDAQYKSAGLDILPSSKYQAWLDQYSIIDTTISQAAEDGNVQPISIGVKINPEDLGNYVNGDTKAEDNIKETQETYGSLPPLEKLQEAMEDAQYGAKHFFCLNGAPGTGKSTAAYIEAARYGLPITTVACSTLTEPDSLMGMWQIANENGMVKYFVHEALRRFRHGGFLLLDELNLVRDPRLAGFIMMLSDGTPRIQLPDGSTINRHPHFYIVSTMNPEAQGTGAVNEALLSRFRHMHIALTKSDALDRLAYHFSCANKTFLGMLYDVLEKVKVYVEENEAGNKGFLCSYRQLSDIVALIGIRSERGRKVSIKGIFESELFELLCAEEADKSLIGELHTATEYDIKKIQAIYDAGGTQPEEEELVTPVTPKAKMSTQSSPWGGVK